MLEDSVRVLAVLLESERALVLLEPRRRDSIQVRVIAKLQVNFKCKADRMTISDHWSLVMAKYNIPPVLKVILGAPART